MYVHPSMYAGARGSSGIEIVNTHSRSKPMTGEPEMVWLRETYKDLKGSLKADYMLLRFPLFHFNGKKSYIRLKI